MKALNTKLNYFQGRQECRDKLLDLCAKWEMDDNNKPTMTIEVDDEFMSVIYSTVHLLDNYRVKRTLEKGIDYDTTRQVWLPS